MILNDHEIKLFASMSGIHPFNPSQLNPTSYDIAMGNTLAIETETGMKPFHLSDSETYALEPGQFALLSVREHIDLRTPYGMQYLSTVTLLKSSRSREGLQLLRAGWAEAGYYGNLTLAVKNVTQHSRITLFPGFRFAQLVFFPHNPPKALYDGNYQGDTTATASRGYFPV